MRSFYFLPATLPPLDREDVESIYRYFCEISVVELFIDPLVHSILFFSRDIKKIYIEIFLNFFDEDFRRKGHDSMNLWIIWGYENWLENQKVFRKLETSMPEELRRLWRRKAEEFQADLATLRGRYEHHIERRNKLLSEKTLTRENDSELGKEISEAFSIFLSFGSNYFEPWIKLAELTFSKDLEATKRLKYISENSPFLLIKRILEDEKKRPKGYREAHQNQYLSRNHYTKKLKRITNESLLPWKNEVGSHWFQQLEDFATQNSPHGLDWENVTFISQKRSAFVKYLRLNGLLIDCLKNSAEVSSEVELLIEERLLWPFNDSSLQGRD